MRLALFALAIASSSTMAQNLPPPSRTVYRCEDGGKVHYSDAPCLGAKKIEVQPTRGLNKSTGKELVGQDVSRERTQDAVANGMRPLTGKSTEALYRSGRRAQLSPDAQRLCQRLDRELPQAEAAEISARTAEQRHEIQQQLLKLRTAFRDNRCE
jgi:Domain of unknown function (DUF4124)